MKITAVIAEGNPLHNGHSFLFHEARKRSRADALIVLMSGDFVQRGEPALLDKHRRARMALAAGADLVLMLPTVYAIAPAEIFAHGAIMTLHAAGIVDTLFFGSEAGALEPLARLSLLLPGQAPPASAAESSAPSSLPADGAAPESSPAAFQETLFAAMKAGMSYPRAVREAFAVSSPADAALAGLLDDAPNNVLGIEYLRALRATDGRIAPMTIARKAPSDTVTSAEALRNLLRDALTGEKAPALRGAPQRDPQERSRLLRQLSPYLPPASLREMESVLADGAGRPVFTDALDAMLRYRLAVCDPGEISAIGDIGADLARRIAERRLSCAGFEAFAAQIKSKAFTLARIRRGLLQLLLDIRRETRARMLAERCTVLRVLGFRETARPLLGMLGAHRKSGVPLIVRGADFFAPADPLHAELISLDLRAGALYGALSFPAAAGRSEAEKPPVIF